MPRRPIQRPQPKPVRPAPAAVLRFAEKVMRGVHANRAAKLAAGRITPEEAAQDIALAVELHRWAKAHFLGEAPLN